MFKHQVVGVRREDSWRSDRSEHIVGICTLEAVDGEGRTLDLAPGQVPKLAGGAVSLKLADGTTVAPVVRCRYWALEEVVRALAVRKGKSRQHEFCVLADGAAPVKIYAYRGRDGQPWISTHGDNTPDNNLENQELRRCTPGGCALIAEAGGAIARWEGPYH